MFKLISLVIILAIFSMPILVAAQAPIQNTDQEPKISDAQQAIADAERDAKARINPNVWLIFGCVGGLLTVAYTYFYEPTPSAAALLGKSPEYVAHYTDTYVMKSKDMQMKSAAIGCGFA